MPKVCYKCKKVVVVTGPEGVGKTTQIILLTKKLNKLGLNTRLGYIRSSSLPVRIIKKLLMRSGRIEKTVTELGDTIVDADHNIVSRLATFFLIIDTAVGIMKDILYRVMSTATNSAIIFERYLNDLISDYAYSRLFYQVSNKVFRGSMALLILMSKKRNPLIVSLDADLDTLLERQYTRGRSDLVIFVLHQKLFNQRILNYFSDNVITIDTSNLSIPQTNNKILNIIMKECRC